MANAFRPSMLRHIRAITPARQALTKRPLPASQLSAFHTSAFSSQPLLLLKSTLRYSPTRYLPSSAIRIIAFHTSGRKPILPAEPQVIDGTANDPAPVPKPSPIHGSYHWTFERLIAAALIPLTVAPFAAGTLNPVTDAILCATIIIHSHIGFESIIIDYLPQKRVPKTRALAWWGLRAGTVLVAVGLYEFETNDVGLTEAVKRIWKA